MKVSKEMFYRWSKYADLYCRENGAIPSDIMDGKLCWTIAYRLDIPKEAYHAGLNDTHITTALRKIFQNAVFSN